MIMNNTEKIEKMDIRVNFVCNFFEMNLEWMEEGDCRLEGEDDYIKYLKEQGGYEYIVGDPLLEQFGGYQKEFINVRKLH